MPSARLSHPRPAAPARPGGPAGRARRRRRGAGPTVAGAFLLAAALTGAPAWAQQPDGGAMSCLLEPSKKVRVASPVAGVIESLTVERGDRVRKGQVLARLQSGLERANLKAARAQLAFAERRGERNEDLFAKRLISRDDKDQMETEIEVARAELEQASERLRLRTIRSPLSGTVIERSASPGEFVGSDPILTIVDIDPLYVEVIAPVSELGRIRKGMRAEVIPDPIGGSYQATVVIVDPVVDPTSDTFGVRLELPNPDHRLPAGLKCAIRFLAE